MAKQTGPIYHDPHEESIINSRTRYRVLFPFTLDPQQELSQETAQYGSLKAFAEKKIKELGSSKGVMIYAVGKDQFGGEASALCAKYNAKTGWVESHLLGEQA